jgi:hypothetical protein
VAPHVDQIRIHVGMDALARPNALPQACLKRGVVPHVSIALNFVNYM